MNQRDKVIGFELVCRALGCVHNDQPACLAHSERRPVIIGLHGRCIRYTKRDDVVRGPDEEKQ